MVVDIRCTVDVAVSPECLRGFQSSHTLTFWMMYSVLPVQARRLTIVCCLVACSVIDTRRSIWFW